VPIVATDCLSGPREILDGGRHGRLVEVGDVDGLARAIRSALAGEVPAPASESWRPYEQDFVVSQYLEVLVGE
jgi:glycosyltransferase involved in cell wall biosynthesis